MQFCHKCGGILVQKTKRFVCVKCGTPAKDKIKIASSEKMDEKQQIGLLKEKDSSVWPTIAAVCPKCGHREAYFWSAQTRSTDEAETKFFRCTKCKHTWREYS